MAREIVDLKAEVRTGTGKGAARQARREGNVPGIIYGDGADPQPIKMNYNYLLTKLRQGRFLQTLFNLKVEGQPTLTSSAGRSARCGQGPADARRFHAHPR
jgi:large subunit ribosomal protein L25